MSSRWVMPGLARAIVLRRTIMNVTRTELAEDAEISYAFLSEIERGRKQPSRELEARLMKSLEVTTAEQLIAWAKLVEEVQLP